MIFASVTSSLRQSFPARRSEWACGTMLFLWSVVLMLNHDLFEQGRTYKALGAIMAQDKWAWICLICGGGRLIVLAINGAWRRSPHIRGLSAFVATFFWFQISLGAAQSDVLATGLAIYPVLFFLDAYNAIQAMGEAGISDATRPLGAGNGTDT